MVRVVELVASKVSKLFLIRRQAGVSKLFLIRERDADPTGQGKGWQLMDFRGTKRKVLWREFLISWLC